MTTLSTIESLAALPYFWTIGKGRTRPDEPLWAVQLCKPDKNGISDGTVAFAAEGDTLMECVERALAWAAHRAADAERGREPPGKPGGSEPA